jgi:hypothetical protein
MADGLTAKPFWDASADADQFPWAAQLEANANIILEEFEHQQLLQKSKLWERAGLGLLFDCRGWAHGMWRIAHNSPTHTTY